MLNIRVKKYKEEEDKPEVPDTFNLLQPESSFMRSGKPLIARKFLKVANKRKGG